MYFDLRKSAMLILHRKLSEKNKLPFIALHCGSSFDIFEKNIISLSEAKRHQSKFVELVQLLFVIQRCCKSFKNNGKCAKAAGSNLRFTSS